MAGALLALVLLGMPALVLSLHAATTGFLEICYGTGTNSGPSGLLPRAAAASNAR